MAILHLYGRNALKNNFMTRQEANQKLSVACDLIFEVEKEFPRQEFETYN